MRSFWLLFRQNTNMTLMFVVVVTDFINTQYSKDRFISTTDTHYLVVMHGFILFGLHHAK